MTSSTECLTEQQIAELQASAPGSVPEALASHLAGCERCQSRVLFGAARRAGMQREPPKLPSLRRALLLLGLVVLAMAAFFWSLKQLTGR